MRYPRELIEEIRMQNDIVAVISQYVPLKQKGSSYFGLCPFHHEKTPSFSVNSEKQFYYCFGCGASGNVYGFLMEMENMSFPEAVQELAQRANISLPEPDQSAQTLAAERLKSRLMEIHKIAGRFYYDCLQSDAGTYARSYMQKRQMLPNVARKFGIGYAPDNRHALYDHLLQQNYSIEDMVQSGLVIPDKSGNGYHDRFRGRLMFPIFDVQSRVIAFGGRILDSGEPKYLNSPETPIFSKSRNLYGLHLAKATRSKELILVEGYMDMFSLYQAGFHNVVASLGTAFNQEHARTLKKYADSVILLYDSDDAGTNAALRAIDVLVQNGLRVRVTQVPDGKDPDEFIKQNGAKAFSKLLVDAVHYISFQIACIQRKYDNHIPEHRVRFATEAAAVLSKLESDIERNVYTTEVSRMTGVAENALQSEIKKQRQKEDASFQKEAEQRRMRLQRQYGQTEEAEKGVLDAQKTLLYFSANHKYIYQALKQVLSKEDFPTPVYADAFDAIATLWEEEDHVFVAQLISFFEDAPSQRRVTEIFTTRALDDETYDLSKGINEAVVLLKRTNIDRKIAHSTTAEEIQAWLEEKRKLEALHITI